MAARSVSSSQRLLAPQRQWRAAICLVLPIGIGVAAAFRSLGDVPLCAFKHLTGVPCPLCGGIRACAALAQGDVVTAWLLNPGLLPLLTVAALHSGLLLAEGVSGHRLGPPQALSLAWKLAGGFWLVSWLWRVLSWP